MNSPQTENEERNPLRASAAEKCPYWFLDSRSLGLFRILLGVVTLWTLVDMAIDAASFFGPDGVLPAETAWSGYSAKPWLFSVLFAFPESVVPMLLVFALGIVGAILLLLGRGSRAGAVLAWWAFGSLAARNPLILHAGDSLLSIMLLVAAVLPVDRHLTWQRSPGEEPRLISNFASTLWMFQLSIVYLAAAGVKLPNPAWLDGTHLERLLAGTECVTGFGNWLSHHVVVTRSATIGSLVLEVALGLLLVALPSSFQRSRLWLVGGALGFHLMIALTLQVSLFPILSLTALSTILPPVFWERLNRARVTSSSWHLPVPRPARCWGWQMAAAVLGSVGLAWVAFDHVFPQYHRLARPVEAVLFQLNWKNNWGVFAATPDRRDRLGVEVVLKSGARLDLLVGMQSMAAEFDSLPSETDRFGGSRWRFFLFSNVVQRPHFRFLAARYLEVTAARYARDARFSEARWELVLYSAAIPREEPLRLTREVLAVYPKLGTAEVAPSPY